MAGQSDPDWCHRVPKPSFLRVIIFPEQKVCQVNFMGGFVPVVVTCGAQLRTAKGEKSPPAAHYAKKQANIPPLGRVSRLAANSNWVPLGGQYEVP